MQYIFMFELELDSLTLNTNPKPNLTLSLTLNLTLIHSIHSPTLLTSYADASNTAAVSLDSRLPTRWRASNV